MWHWITRARNFDSASQAEGVWRYRNGREDENMKNDGALVQINEKKLRPSAALGPETVWAANFEACNGRR
jgi:hypothetical protein